MLQEINTDTVHTKVDTIKFLGNTIKSEFQELQIIENPTESWIFFLIVALLAILSFGLFFHKKKFGLMLQASIIQRHSNQLIRESNPLKERISIVLLLVYLFSFSLFLYYGLILFSNLNEIISGIILYSLILSFVFISWFIKTSIIAFTGTIFYTRQQAYQHIVSNFLLNISVGLLYLIIIIPMIYSYPLLMFYTGITLTVIIFILKVYKGFIIGLNFSKFSKFHLFLYLCTLEILPVIVLLKFCYVFLEGI